ncbi:hypothetical protein VKT23_020674 [Stygiomarasmius scandens]|uniref:Zn(2)-C6 fungal-type domain-containing protein n=1 Tax=Marasmiellus scandens TaxID=2682957 RepID=A0ABR1IKB3_9AGAR
MPKPSRLATPDFRVECPSPPPFNDPEPQPPQGVLDDSSTVVDRLLWSKYERDLKAWKESSVDFASAVKQTLHLRSTMQQDWRENVRGKEAKRRGGKSAAKGRSRNEVEEQKEEGSKVPKESKKTNSKTRIKLPGKGKEKERSDGVGMDEASGKGKEKERSVSEDMDEEDTDREDEDEDEPDAKPSDVRCERCTKAGTDCIITPGAANRLACDLCRKKKMPCSLVGAKDAHVVQPVSEAREVGDAVKSDGSKLQGSTPAAKPDTVKSPAKSTTAKPATKATTAKPATKSKSATTQAATESATTQAAIQSTTAKAAVKPTTAKQAATSTVTEDHSMVKPISNSVTTENPEAKSSTAVELKSVVKPTPVVKPDSSAKRVLVVEIKSNPVAKRDVAKSCIPDPNETLSPPHHADDADETAARSSTPVSAAAAEKAVPPAVSNDDNRLADGDDDEANPDPHRELSDAEDARVMRLANELERSNDLKEDMLQELRRSNRLQERVLDRLEQSMEMQKEATFQAQRTNRQLTDLHSLLTDTLTSEVTYQQSMWNLANEMSGLLHPITGIAMVALDRRLEHLRSGQFGARDLGVDTTRKIFSPSDGPTGGSSSSGVTMQRNPGQGGQKRGRDDESVLEERYGKRRRGDADEENEQGNRHGNPVVLDN